MKRIILSVMVMAFAVAVQAGDATTGQDKEKAGCCASKPKTSVGAKMSQDNEDVQAGCCSSKVKTSLETKGSCPLAASACSKQAPAKQTALLSPKAASDAGK